jgi:hypothetical protein
MFTETREIHTCDHCGKYYKSKYHAGRHEKYCKGNPNNKHACFDFCRHLRKDMDEGKTYFYCVAKNDYCYSYKAELRGIEEGFRMPLECGDYVKMNNCCGECHNSNCEDCEEYETEEKRRKEYEKSCVKTGENGDGLPF